MPDRPAVALEAEGHDLIARGHAKLAEAARVRAESSRPTPSRVLLSDVALHGAPSRRWVEDQARAGRIAIRGPRGARGVDAGDLVALLAATTIKRRAHSLPPHDEGPIDASAVVLDLARRRAS